MELPEVEVMRRDLEKDVVGKRIKEVEHESDELTHDLYRLINQTFVTPLDREDIAALAQRLDDVPGVLLVTVCGRCARAHDLGRKSAGAIA